MHPTVPAPFKCIFCRSTKSFRSVEHVVPESLGNDLVVLAKGWVCDTCNNTLSAVEGRVLSASILGFERCRLGVITKKRKPARANLHGITWFAKPESPDGAVAAEADWTRQPVLMNRDGTRGRIAFPIHDESCYDLARLLLKIGVEIVSVGRNAGHTELQRDWSAAISHVLGREGAPWPYFVMRSKAAKKQLVSVFADDPSAHEYIEALGFDIFIHEVDEDVICFFEYGDFFAGVAITTRGTGWRSVLVDWAVPYVGCPADWAAQAFP